MQNPLLEQTEYPVFSTIKPQHIEPALTQILKECRAELKKLLRQKDFSWDNLMQPLEEMDEKLHVMWATVGHLNAVISTTPLREAHDACLPALSAYATEIGQNQQLYDAIKNIATAKTYRNLAVAQKKIISDDLRDFKLAGVALPPKAKQQFATLQQQLAQLSSKFSNNLLDATNGWTKLITHKSELKGLTNHAIKAANIAAEQHKQQGWLLTLEQPSYLAVLTHADLRQLRQEVYDAYITRASDQGPNAGKWDNTQVMHEIVTDRTKLAHLLDFNNFAEYSLASKMAKSTPTVIRFLNKLAKYSSAQAKAEYKELQQFALQDGVEQLQPWDLTYYSEKLKQQKYNVSQEELRPYFTEPQVLAGMFKLVKRLFGITIKTIENADIWHKDVKVFELYDAKKVLRSRFYLDLYARPNKQSGAWMNDFRARRRLPDNSIQIPVAYIVCNFNTPIGDDPSLLTHRDVETIFHEFGHGLQHMLTTVDYADVAGINGVPWDAVELASQFMENWCWHKPVLDLISKHYKTGKKLPQKLFDNMVAAKNFQSGLQMLRQLEFSLFDFRLHLEFDSRQKHQIQKILDDVRQQFSVLPHVDYNRFQHGFAHIFGGGYAAGYYSYKWAEVLASDAFAKFEEDGIFNPDTGQAYLECILEPGGSVDPMVLFKKFRGRAPKLDALLQHSGIIK